MHHQITYYTNKDKIYAQQSFKTVNKKKVRQTKPQSINKDKIHNFTTVVFTATSNVTATVVTTAAFATVTNSDGLSTWPGLTKWE